LLNETWFIAEGLVWGWIGWMVLGPSSARRWWIGSAAITIAVLFVVGMLSAFGIIGRVVVG